jgi:hypothetical protein
MPTKWPKIVAKISTLHNTFQDVLKLGFLVRKYTIWQPCIEQMAGKIGIVTAKKSEEFLTNESEPTVAKLKGYVT